MGSISEPNTVPPVPLREPIAIVGSSCRFPGGANSPSKLWELLKNPEDLGGEIPASRFDTKAFYNKNSQHHGSTNTKYAYLLQDEPRLFDRDFFNISPKEVEAMDPQQRCLLETVYEGVESAGYSIPHLQGSSTGVFVGATCFDYQAVSIRGLDSLPQYYATGGSMAILANRLSYFFDWRGPSVACDTACSSSLVALHQAVLSLRSGEIDMAVAAGANLILGPELFIAYSNLNMLSPNGRSWMWDSSADGYTRGEGFASVILKTLSQAIADDDHIECIIRETGVNSDGRTPGITMPSAGSQSQLIRETYRRCGLDPVRNRPHYFEAHGTGTLAGDPIEAQAIHDTFFPPNSGPSDGHLYVGSIKTVIGHTEGTAGLAGVLKASLAVQNGQIPGNLHFQELNPKIRPYSKNLSVPTSLKPWPTLSSGEPRRVSVNSFGFGGTNAHAIIESWDGAYDRYSSEPHPGGLFVLSANSAQAVAAKAIMLASYLRQHPDTDLGRLSRTLFQRNSDFLFRAAFSATSATQLAEKLESRVEALKKNTRIPAIPKALPPRILGVFTGQGAQWATMGKELYEASSLFRKAIHRLQHSLDTLPESDRPDWTLINELAAPKETSRVGIAIILQPICTALQIALVDILHAAGIRFAAVVGHSSGEIAAAYASGYLNAHDAIRIAYYRGFHSVLAQGPDGKRGKMMAVGMSLASASAFCDEFGPNLRVAASNSPTSCTLAGDAVLIDQAKERLDQDKIFARVLAVDTAYHSHHMLPCAEPYLESLRNCGVKALKGPKKCQWYSSVWGPNGRSRSFNSEEGLKLLDGQYWVDNLTNTVQFSQAVNRAVSEEYSVLDLALEVGPHPSLKGPTSEVIKSLTGLNLPYSGVLNRGQGAVEAFADSLGLIWTCFPSSGPLVTFDGIQRALPLISPKKPSILKDLPTYPWDHDSLVWRESRASRLFRNGQPQHELLGRPTILGEDSRREIHWRHVFKLSELPWVSGHTIQGQVLFPATGYVTMAYEAAVRLVDDQQTLRLVELHDIEIVRTMGMLEDSSGLEVIFTIRVTSQTDNCITAEVACYSGDVDGTKLDGPVNALTAHFSGGVRLFLGASQKDALSTRKRPLLPMNTLDMEQFYSYLSKVGYNYSGAFTAPSVDRHLNHAVVSVPNPPESSSVLASVHPAILDTTIQGILAAFSYPEDGRLGAVYLPTGIDCVRINMTAASPGFLMADSRLTSSGEKGLTGDVDLFNASDETIQVQMRGVQWTALNQSRDRAVYASETWVRDVTCGIEPSLKVKFSPEDEVLRKLLVRTAHFYLRRLRSQIKPSEMLVMGKHRRHMMKWVRNHLFPQIEAGKVPDIEPEWEKDTLEDIQKWSAPYLAAGNNDMLILHAVGENFAGIARGITPALQVLLKDDMLDRLYVEGVGFADGNLDLESLVKQLGHRYPRMKILEVGAGTGGTTRAVLSALGDRYASYMYTDISAGFFEPAMAKFSQHAAKMSFKMLNIEKDPVDQGLEEGAYDVVVASNALHATRSLKETVSNCRRLLRPGGYLVLLEITTDHLPIQMIMGTLPGWFLGIDEGRVWVPTLSLDEWDKLLKETGFSGVETSSTPSFCSAIISQATNEAFQEIRQPLSVTSRPADRPIGHVLVVSDMQSELASKSQALLASIEGVVQCDIGSLEDIKCPTGAIVLSLCDLNSPVFGQMTVARFEAMQDLFRHASAVLWVTSGAASGKSPLANVTVGLGRTLLAERTDLQLQFLDVDNPTSLDASLLATLLLRLTGMNQYNPSEVLWTQEPHLALREDGAYYIPRVLALDSVDAVEMAEPNNDDEIAPSLGPVQHNPNFPGDKTYILFGMTGDLGISIALRMVDNGARNVVLTSRHPDVSAGVFELMSQKGAVLRVIPVDITKKESLRAAYTEIKSSLPPVGGIINGAMVLRDRAFLETSWNDFEAVLAPKVAGTRNLDELFGEDEALDFFIGLSSATSIVGNIGQSAYSAANHYMASLVRLRRERGLAGSVVVIGLLTGLGYIYRSDRKRNAAIEKSLLPQLVRQGETDLHDMLAKAIEWGRPDSNLPTELITGVRRVFTETRHEDPRLSCYLLPEGGQEEDISQKEADGNIKVEAQLAITEDPKEGLAILVKCFSQSLGSMLQLDPTQIDVDMPVADHGVDSLVSVRIREWFLKELGVDVPVLKLMSTNHTLTRVCEDALVGWRNIRAGPKAEPQTASNPHEDPEMDWQKEVTDLIDGIPSLIPPGADLVKDAPRTSGRRIVLTGCTGFLGTNMLRNLVADESTSEVHCLCMRARPLRVKDAKIREYKGDLVKPLLGLSTDDFTRLCQTADLIIHVGADVAHLKSYEMMRAANVVSTQYLLAMATPRRVPVHFVSSSSVAMLQKDTSELAEVPPSSFWPPSDADSLLKNAIGYAASKWMGEILLERAEGLPAVVHRFPNIMGPDAPEEIPLVSLDKYCAKMRAVPALDPKQWQGELDIIDVGDVVPEFMAKAYAHDPLQPFAVHNYCSENRYVLSNLEGMYNDRLGTKVKVLPVREWMQKAKAFGMPPGVEATWTGNEVFVSPVLRKGKKL
ncbi:Male sterility NAD-binding [Penicillium angulare]|uniref:Male sterility NAD-binding n=1 Tax=Penicillium angulare TaxID=116970 RepID=A0A9W9FHE5_9EURO|nr:Male sterility NAD-binding [Penicillium angulare]